jgi:hypothetical protein
MWLSPCASGASTSIVAAFQVAATKDYLSTELVQTLEVISTILTRDIGTPLSRPLDTEILRKPSAEASSQYSRSSGLQAAVPHRSSWLVSVLISWILTPTAPSVSSFRPVLPSVSDISADQSSPLPVVSTFLLTNLTNLRV